MRYIFLILVAALTTPTIAQASLCGVVLETNAMVRFRGADRRMTSGIIRSVDLTQSRSVIEAAGDTTSVTNSSVFSPRSGLVGTPDLGFYWSVTCFELTPSLIAFLNGGARAVDSLAGEAPTKQVVDRVLAYVRGRIEPDSYSARTPPFSVDQLLRSARGGCVHFALLTAAILAEAGYAPAVVRVAGHPGHVWLEMQTIDGAGHADTLIIDGATRTTALPYGAVLAAARRDPHGIEARYYAHPDRVYELLAK